MINYFLLLDKNQTTDQKVVSSNPAGRAIKKHPAYGVFFYGFAKIPGCAGGIFLSPKSPERYGDIFKKLS